MQSLTFIARAIKRFCNRQPPSKPEMAAPNLVDGSAARLPADFNDDEPMEVDPRVTEMVTAALMYSRTTADDLLRTIGRKPGEIPTQGEQTYLTQPFLNSGKAKM